MTYQNPDELHTKVELLLPWYVNGTLSQTEHSLVTAHLDDCVQCQQELVMCKSMQSAIVDGSPSPILPQSDSAALFRLIDQNQDRKRDSWPRTRYFAAAAAVVAVAGFLWLGNKGDDHVDNQQFQTATSAGGQVSMEVVIDLEFDARSSQFARTQLLEEIETDTKVPQPIENVVRLTVQFPVTSLEQLEAHRLQLERRALVRSVELVALQVPVRQTQ